MKTLPDASVDMVLTDLPYGTTQNKWDSLISLDQLWAAWKRVCKPGAPIVLFTQQPFTTTVAASNLKQFKTEWIWVKSKATGHLNAKRYPLKAHENILVFCDRTPPYHPQMGTGKPYSNSHKPGDSGGNYGTVGYSSVKNCTTRYPQTILTFPVAHKAKHHDTEKPVALLEYLINTYTCPNMTVLDCTMGSGSTGVAALNTGRKFIGIERDPEYFKIAEQRMTCTDETLRLKSAHLAKRHSGR